MSKHQKQKIKYNKAQSKNLEENFKEYITYVFFSDHLDDH